MNKLLIFISLFCISSKSYANENDSVPFDEAFFKSDTNVSETIAAVITLFVVIFVIAFIWDLIKQPKYIEKIFDEVKDLSIPHKILLLVSIDWIFPTRIIIQSTYDPPLFSLPYWIVWGLIGLSFWIFSKPEPQKPEPQKRKIRWEYKLAYMPSVYKNSEGKYERGDILDRSLWLSEFGEDGWKCFFMEAMGEEPKCYFRREKQEDNK